MAVLRNHLEQINLSAQSISELEFPPSKPFTNALLHNQEITALIRDTEPHERGLFSVDPNIRHSNGQVRASGYGGDTQSRRKNTQFGGQSHSSAVARVLGNDMLRKIQSSNRDSSRGRGVDIDLLLDGAEKLCAAYDVAGTRERIASLRTRHQQTTNSIKVYEEKITKQQSSRGRIDKAGGDNFQRDNDGGNSFSSAGDVQRITEDELKAEEEIVNELEARKKALEVRVAGMERDLGGLRE